MALHPLLSCSDAVLKPPQPYLQPQPKYSHCVVPTKKPRGFPSAFSQYESARTHRCSEKRRKVDDYKGGDLNARSIQRSSDAWGSELVTFPVMCKHTGLKKVHCIACGWKGEPIREDARIGETFDMKEWLKTCRVARYPTKDFP